MKQTWYRHDQQVVVEALRRGERPDMPTTMASGPLDELVGLHEARWHIENDAYGELKEGWHLESQRWGRDSATQHGRVKFAVRTNRAVRRLSPSCAWPKWTSPKLFVPFCIAGPSLFEHY